LSLWSQYMRKFYVIVGNAVIFQAVNPMPQL